MGGSIPPPPIRLHDVVLNDQHKRAYPRVSGLSHKETTINIRCEATQRVMAARLTRPTHKIAIQLHVMAESCTTCSSRSRRLVRKLLTTAP
jgi:hypothetical protein